MLLWTSRSKAIVWTVFAIVVLTVFAGIADFERSLIVDRTSAGRIAAKARGVRFGPSPALSAEQIAHARQLIHEDKKPVAEVARLLGVHRATLYRAFKQDWSGRATDKLVDAIAANFRIPRYLLVKESSCKPSGASGVTARSKSSGGAHPSSATAVTSAAQRMNTAAQPPRFG